MIKEYYADIRAGRQVRANLIALRDELKTEKGRSELKRLLDGDFTGLIGLLEDGDPKVRRNAALILGRLGSAQLLPVLFDAYQRERTLFVRADYLAAIAELDYRPVLGKLEERLAELRSVQVSQEERKHIAAELRALQTMVLRYRDSAPHRFRDPGGELEVILVTNRSLREATARQIKTGRVVMLAGGLRVEGARLDEIRKIRTYRELLFPVQIAADSELSGPEQLGRAAARPTLELARRFHEGDGAFLFRLEYKGNLALEKRGAFLRRMADAVEADSKGQLLNSVSDYELELRLLERKDGSFIAMIKFFTMPDQRFAYRKESVAASISPVNAALTAELARPYLKEQAQVLDPFCGVGTMLVERDRAVRAGIMYGIDLFGEAIEKARANTRRAGCNVFYINKDFFAFEHGYLFDEIITDMPQVTANQSRHRIRRLYEDFFEKAGGHLKEEAVLILYSTEPEFVTEAVRRRPEYRIAQRYVVNEKNETSVFIIQRRAERV